MAYDRDSMIVEFDPGTGAGSDGRGVPLPFPLAPGFHRSPGPCEPAGAKARILSPRERMVIELLADGLRVSRIADQMGISEPTVALHLSNCRRKLRAATTPQAVARALLYGEITVRG